MKKILLSTLLLSVSALADFQEPTADDVRSMVERIQRVQKLINTTSPVSNCDPEKDKSCSFNDVCDSYSNKGQDFYLFKDSQGRSIANYQLLFVIQTAETCAEMDSPLRQVNDPFTYFEQMYSEKAAGSKEQLLKNKSLFETRYSQSLKIFDEAQNRVLKILKNKKNSKNQVEIDNMIKRIESIRLEVPRDPDDLGELAQEGCELPNAMYEPRTHSIMLCPQMLNLPEGSLLQILAHEMGHSIDPCFMGFAFDNTGLVNNDSILGPSDNIRKPTINEVPAQKNPFSTLISCFKNEDSLGVKVPTVDELVRRISDSDEDQEEVTQAIKNLRFLKQENETALNKKLPSLINCGFITENGHMQEAFADWMGAEVLASKIAETPDRKKAQEYALSAKSFFASLDCTNLRDVAGQKLKTMVENKCLLPAFAQKIQDNSIEVEASSHPKTSHRINKIFMANPQIRRALGCQQASGLKHCQ